ncbi:MAG: ARPP-1 family domain-containing protein, partial [Desulfotignum sp.]
ELVGAKQNRIVNTTILVPAEADIIIPVSCVEQGRWSDTPSGFSSKERIMPSNMRAMKSQQVNDSVRDRGSFRSEQSAIWDEVSKKAHRRDAVSPSMAMSEIYEKEKPVINQYIKGFKNIDSQVGAAFMINGEIAGMDCFGKPETFSAVFKKLIGSYALDAIDFFEEGQEHKVLKSKLTGFIKNSANAPVHAQKSVGEGMDCRLETKKITGFALCHKDQIPHMSIFTKTDTDTQGSRMQSFSRRRRHRL